MDGSSHVSNIEILYTLDNPSKHNLAQAIERFEEAILNKDAFIIDALPVDLVELGGLEPPTPCMPCKCSPN